MLLLDLIQNVALLVALSVAYRILLTRYQRSQPAFRKLSFQILNGLMFGLASVVGMMTPMQFSPGIIFDGRSVILAVAGLFGGPLPAFLATAICSAYRLLLGGGGAWVGVAVASEAATLGALFHELRQRRGWRYSAWSYLGIGLLVHGIMLLLILALPDDAGWMALREIGFLILLLYPLATMLVCQLFQDYEEQIRQRAELRESEAELQQAQRLAHIGSWRFDLGSGAVRASAEARRIYGLGDREWTIPEVQTIPLDAYRPMLDEALRALVEKGTPYNVEFRIRRPADGETRDIHSMGKYDPETNAVVGTIQDVTERKEAERSLRRSEERFRLLAELAPVGIVISDREENTLYASPKFVRLFGYDRQSMPTIDAWWEKAYPDPVLRERIRGEWTAGLESSRRDGGEVGPMEYPVTCRDGTVRQIEFRLATSEELNFIVFVDVTERKQMQERIRQMEKMDAIGQLAGGVAHDFNNQLAGIMGYAEMLETRLDTPGLRRYTDNILACTRRAEDLTAKLLAFARRGQYESVPVDVHAIIDEVVDFLQHSIDKRIRIKRELKANPTTTRGDPTQLQNALLNLAINARDAMEEGGELVFDTAITELDTAYCAEVPYDIAPGSYLRVCVTDTGCGISPENLTRIFEPFFTTKEVGKGTGMGLAAVYGTIKNHGGAINVYSEMGQGTTFKLFLPLERERAKPIERPRQAVPAPRPATILMVDDEETLRAMATELLTELGYRVVCREHGEAGLVYFREHWREIDLVILDMVMPRMNGQETFRAMCRIDPHVNVLLASGYSLNGAARELLEEGVRGFVQKPFDRAELSARVASAITTETP